MLWIGRRTFLAGASALSFCAGVAADPNPAAAQSAGSGKVIIGLSTDPTTFQPYYFSIAFYHLYNQFYNVLVRLDSNQKPQPELAESWSLSPDGLKLSLKLRGDVMFQSGRKMTADDVKRSWERATSKDVNANSKSLFQTVERVTVVDPLTVTLEFRGPNPGLYDLLDQLWIIDDDLYDKSATQPIGTGPFVLAEYRPGDKMVLKPFASYWNKGKPKLAEAEFRIIKDPQALILNLESKTIDAVGQVNVPDAARLERAGFEVVTASEGILYAVMFNNKPGSRFANNAKLRQVFVHATDRQRFNRIALAGKATTLCMPWLPTSFAYDKALDSTCDFDLAESKRLLAEAGYPNGMDLTVYTSTQWYYGMTKLAEIMQADLKQIGINVKLEDVETAEYTKRHNNFEYEVIMTLTGRVNRDPSTMLTATSTMRAKDNAAGYDNPRYTQLVADASATVDPDKRRKVFDEINKIIREDMYTMPVATSPFLFGYNKKVQNVHFSLDSLLYLEDVTVK